MLLCDKTVIRFFFFFFSQTKLHGGRWICGKQRISCRGHNTHAKSLTLDNGKSLRKVIYIFRENR